MSYALVPFLARFGPSRAGLRFPQPGRATGGRLAAFLPAAAAFLGLAAWGAPTASAFQGAPFPAAVKVEGVLAEGGASRAVTLWIRGEDSLLEWEGFRIVFLAGRAQRQPAGAAAWPAALATPGHQDAFFMPFAVLGRLERDYRRLGPAGGSERFGRTVKRSRFLGRSPEEFEFEARLGGPGVLSELTVSDRQGTENTRLVYSGYRAVEGVLVPRRVERYLDGALERVLKVESVSFLAGLDEGLIRIVEPGSR